MIIWIADITIYRLQAFFAADYCSFIFHFTYEIQI